MQNSIVSAETSYKRINFHWHLDYVHLVFNYCECLCFMVFVFFLSDLICLLIPYHAEASKIIITHRERVRGEGKYWNQEIQNDQPLHTTCQWEIGCQTLFSARAGPELSLWDKPNGPGFRTVMTFIILCMQEVVSDKPSPIPANLTNWFIYRDTAQK